MKGSQRRRRQPAVRRRRGRYHHGNLRQALIDEALRVIKSGGVEQLTLRAAGEALGVSRTALYRHFSDKQALLAAVGREGFRTFRIAMTDAWDSAGGGLPGFAGMGRAYLEFALAHPSHYRVMFGRFVESCEKDPEFSREATAAFKTLVDAIVRLQKDGLMRHDDPLMLARYIWATMHGIAMLVIDGQLRGVDDNGEALIRFAGARLGDALGISQQP